jgi:uncharacterized protein (DUF4415 family)
VLSSLAAIFSCRACIFNSDGKLPSFKKERASIGYDADVISAFKATGENWQAKMNDVLREWMNSHPNLITQ